VTDLQRSKRLVPRFYASRNKWVVDVPPDMNQGVRSQKLFPNQAEAFKWIGEFSSGHLLSAIRSKVSKTPAAEKVEALVGLYISTLQARGLSREGVGQAVACLRRFTETFGHLTPASIAATEIEAWISRLPYASRTVWNHYSQARQFFNWRGVRQLCPVTPFLDVDTPEKTNSDIRRQILTPDDMRELLALDLEPWTKCKLVLGGFAGLRVYELSRMTYESIDDEYGEIIVTKEQSKQGKAMRPRSVTLEDAVRRHLPKGKGPLVGNTPEWSWYRWMPKKGHLGGKEIPLNALRHSYCSYKLAHTQDAVATAYQMGHTSPRLVYETYANAVSRRDAAAWWAL
jgi:integrase